jgi:acetylornithine deacetylase/succinyl-diaminopimelate desuccinylase-like protein
MAHVNRNCVLFRVSKVLGLPIICGGLGYGGRAHAANEYMSIQGLREFETFVATFLYFIAGDKITAGSECPL